MKWEILRVILEARHFSDGSFTYFVTRKHGYSQKGRLQTQEEAIQKDREILRLLQRYEIPFHFADFRNIIKDVLGELDVESKGTMGGQQF